MKWTVTTVVWTDPDANIDKFYRTFASDNGIEIRQNGRIGVLGQFQWFNRGNGTAALHEAAGQISGKTRKGYKERTETVFVYPDDRTPNSKEAARHLANAFAASGQPGSAPAELSDRAAGRVTAAATPAPVQVPGQINLDGLLADTLSAINAAIQDKTEGMSLYISLREQVNEAAGKLEQVRSYHETLETLVLS